MSFIFSNFKVGLKILLVTFIFFSFQYKSYAQSGCTVTAGSQTRLYYNSDPSRNFPNNSGWIAGGASYNIYNSNTECIVDGISGCTVYKAGSTGTASGDILYSGGTEGVLFNYSCPIDDYIPLLFIFTICFFYIRIR